MLNDILIRNRSTSTTAELATASNTIHPIRQPRGPEPGKNFASRKINLEDALSEALARQHITHVGA